jgi:hypothetical protein
MVYNPVFQKIKDFVDQEISQSYNITIKETDSGYYINSLLIENVDNQWRITDSTGNVIQTYHYARMAFLSAFAIHKNKSQKLNNIATWDHQLDIYKHDVDMFIMRLKANPDNPVISDRLGFAEHRLLSIKHEIRNFEKEVGLFKYEGVELQ